MCRVAVASELFDGAALENRSSAERSACRVTPPDTRRRETTPSLSPLDGVLDDLGALVEAMGGETHVIPAERMPGATGLAAIYRH